VPQLFKLNIIIDVHRDDVNVKLPTLLQNDIQIHDITRIAIIELCRINRHKLYGVFNELRENRKVHTNDEVYSP